MLFMEIDSYRSYIKTFSKVTKIKGWRTKVVDLKEKCPHKKIDFGHKKYCSECKKIYWRYLKRMREGLKKVDKKL